MNLEDQRILLTGAAGGIGTELTRLLLEAGARLVLVDRDTAPVQPLIDRLQDQSQALALQADLLDAGQRNDLVRTAYRRFGGIDVVINNAGLMSFRPFSDEDPEAMERLMRLNTLVPMHLARALLPGMLAQRHGRIVNVGSTFGSIGFPWFAAYSTSKFAIRGFSQALRRELTGSGVGVTYVAPRAVRTALNTGAVYRMAEQVGMRMDDPAWVAARIVDALRRERNEVHLGFPESLFSRINALLPGLVDLGVRRQGGRMKPFAEGETA